MALVADAVIFNITKKKKKLVQKVKMNCPSFISKISD